jgi:ketosteroid isomerase-like protein
MDGYSFHAQLSRISPVGLFPDGLRIDVSFAGTVTAGPLAGSPIEGIDYLTIRPDGVGVIDARELVTGPDGVAASIHAEGYIVPPFQVPELPVLASPDFTWPDAELPLHGAARLRSALPALAAANRTVYTFTGSVNMARGSLAVTARDASGQGTHPHAAMLSRGYQAFAAGDLPAVLALQDPGIAWHEPGSNPIAGDYKGHEQVSGFLTQIMHRSGGTFALEIRDIIADDLHAVALVTERANSAENQLAAPATHVWRIADGKLAEFTNYYADQAAVDRFWQQAG